MGVIKCENCENTTFWLQRPVSQRLHLQAQLVERMTFSNMITALNCETDVPQGFFFQLFTMVWSQQVPVSNQRLDKLNFSM